MAVRGIVFEDGKPNSSEDADGVAHAEDNVHYFLHLFSGWGQIVVATIRQRHDLLKRKMVEFAQSLVQLFQVIVAVEREL